MPSLLMVVRIRGPLDPSSIYVARSLSCGHKRASRDIPVSPNTLLAQAGMSDPHSGSRLNRRTRFISNPTDGVLGPDST